MKNLHSRLCVAAVCLVFAFSAWSDWPQFCGPKRDCSSPEKGLARKWPEGGPKVLWTFPLGRGFGSPSERDGEVYVLDRVGEDKKEQEILRCLDLKTGKELWTFHYDAAGEVVHPGSRTQPTIDANNVYSVGALGDLYCVDRKTHKPVWHKNLVKDFGFEKIPMWGIAQAPSLHKGLLIVAPQAPDAFVVAYKCDTGDLVWKAAENLGVVGYTTPVITKLGGVDQVVMFGAGTKKTSPTGRVAGFSLADGKTLWIYDGYQNPIPIPFPTTLPNDRLFITGGYEAGSALIEVKQNAGKWAVKELATFDNSIGSQIQQPVLFGGHLYMNSNSNEREDGMMCLTLDGKVLWKTKDIAPDPPIFEKGSLIQADGLIYNLDGKTGVVRLVEPSPQGYKELAKAKVLDSKEIWAPIALTQGMLLVRDQQQLKCLDVKNP